ncbi:hypothetical protein BJ970_001041 [Saccharopolyspora phatthalungensis]|uniref:Immunity protein Imm1 n=1 Tax=Saccharopolyspora phatthalungensis TaxID=664693 RepID=A0A840Q0I4_9PSEU|nr:hypothetical protein [Saccharopolyspora phatthalungensis]
MPARTDVDQLVRGISEHDQKRTKPECGIAWSFQHQPGDDTPTLMFGVRCETGALMWFDATSALVPAHGTNHDHVDYFLAGAHLMVMPPGAELPIAQAHEAQREFVRTGQRPTCVDWVPDPEFHEHYQ